MPFKLASDATGELISYHKMSTASTRPAQPYTWEGKTQMSCGQEEQGLTLYGARQGDDDDRPFGRVSLRRDGPLPVLPLPALSFRALPPPTPLPRASHFLAPASPIAYSPSPGATIDSLRTATSSPPPAPPLPVLPLPVP